MRRGGLDLGGLVALGRENEDGRFRPLAQPARHLDAINVGQPEVEQDDVGGVLGG